MRETHRNLTGKSTAIITKFVNACWFLFKWTFAAALLVVVGVGGYLYMRLDDEIRRHAEEFLASHYSHLEVRVGAAEFDPERGITLHDLQFAQRDATGQRQSLAEVDQLELAGQFDAKSLLSCSPQIDKVTIRRPHLDAVRDAQGKWNVAAFFPPPQSGKKPAAVEVIDATVSIRDATQSTGRPIVISHVNLNACCKPTAIARDPSKPAEKRTVLTGTIGDELAETCTFSATLDTETGAFTADAAIDALQVEPELIAAFPGLQAAQSEDFDFSGKVNLVANASRTDGSSAVDWKISFDISRGRLSVKGLPRPVSEISATGTATPQLLAVREARAQYGKTNLTMVCDRYGWQRNAPFAIRAHVLIN